MTVSIIIIVALLLDIIFGEPRRWHPLVGFGTIANWLENKLNHSYRNNHFLSFLAGFFAWSLLVLPAILLLWFFEYFLTRFQGMQLSFEILIGILCLTFSLGTKSLTQHAVAVSNALKQSDIALARKKTALIVSRDTSMSDETAINRATIESVLENGGDAIFSAIFWFIIFGAPGVIFYRLSNTLDAMWGYKTVRFNYFGRTAARVDDALNWLPARLTALSYALAGSTLKGLSCWKKQAKYWHGVNPGVVMASGAGALQISLGGDATYHGQPITRPELGCDNIPQVADIERAIRLLYKSIFIWLIIIVAGDYFIV